MALCLAGHTMLLPTLRCSAEKGALSFEVRGGLSPSHQCLKQVFFPGLVQDSAEHG